MSEKKRLAIVVPAYNEEKYLSLTLESLHDQRVREGVIVLVVNNGSTDGTRKLVQNFKRRHPDFVLEIIDEPQKGTGRAADTGFREAIARGYPIIARTDADTILHTSWTTIITNEFDHQPALQLLGGWTLPHHDDRWYRRRDALLFPLGLLMARLTFAVVWRSWAGLKSTPGHNMATRAEAYLATGGFPRSHIDEVDEDIVYCRRVYEQYGWKSLSVKSALRVRTSMRRVRSVHYPSLLIYYTLRRRGYRHRKLHGKIDIR